MKERSLPTVEASWVQAPALGGALGIYPETFEKPSRHHSSTYCQACETIHEDPSSATCTKYGWRQVRIWTTRTVFECNTSRGALTLNRRWGIFTIYASRVNRLKHLCP